MRASLGVELGEINWQTSVSTSESQALRWLLGKPNKAKELVLQTELRRHAWLNYAIVKQTMAPQDRALLCGRLEKEAHMCLVGRSCSLR